jgi:hypothetical protein
VPTYATVDELKARLGITSTVNDAALLVQLEVASLELDRLTVAEPDPLVLAHGDDPRAKEATLLDAARLYGRKDSPGAQTGGFETGMVFVANTDPDYIRLRASLRQALAWGVA